MINNHKIKIKNDLYRTEKKSEKNILTTKIRYIILFSFSIIPFIYLIYCLINIQIVNGESYLLKRNNQYKLVENSSLKRNGIFALSKTGDVFPLADNKIIYKLVIAPSELDKEHLDLIYKLINNITEISEVDFSKKSNKIKDLYEELKIVDNKEAEQIKNLRITGVYIIEDRNRSYPLNEVASQVVGFITNGEDGITGKAGLEKYYNDILIEDITNKTSFFASLFKNIKANQANNYLSPSYGIVTSIEPNVSKFLNTELNHIYKEWKADNVSAIIMESDTGKILAMESIPSFNPNNLNEYSSENFINRNVQNVYELGSIMKPITIAGGIENNLINPNTTYNDTGKMLISGYEVKNFDGKPEGLVTIQTALSKSLNMGMIFIMRLMGFEKFRENILSFKLGEETGIDLPGEVSNKLQNIYEKAEINFATAAFGQGIALTPISMISALNVIANNGVYRQPYLLNNYIDSENNLINLESTNKNEKVISEKIAKTVKSMMVKSLDEFSKGIYKDKQYGMGIKTGTSQLVNPEGGYYTDKTLHSYYAFFPEKKTKFSVLLFQVNPKYGNSSSETLTKHMQNIKNFLISYYNIPPER